VETGEGGACGPNALPSKVFPSPTESRSMDRAEQPEPPDPGPRAEPPDPGSKPRTEPPDSDPKPRAEPPDSDPTPQPAPPGPTAVEPPEPARPTTEPTSPPEPPTPTPPATPPEPPKRRTPAAVLAAIVILWLFAAAATAVALISAVATSFEVSVRYAGAWSPLEFIEPALIAAVAVLCGLLAVKLRSGRDWARHIVVIVTAIVLATALLTGAGLNAGTGIAGTVLFALLLVLLLLRSARDWCDYDAPRHSPRIDSAAHPPHQVLASLLLLWVAAATGLYAGSTGILTLAGNDADLTEESTTWAAGAAIALAIVHAALNIGFSYHRNWARWATLALAAAYTALLAIAAIHDLTKTGPGPWPVLALLSLVPLALIWSMAGTNAREWCRREAAGK
jgi:hypothetical protein